MAIGTHNEMEAAIVRADKIRAKQRADAEPMRIRDRSPAETEAMRQAHEATMRKFPPKGA